MAELHWSGLNFLGNKLLDELIRLYVHPRHLVSAIDTEGDAAEILTQCCPDPGTVNINAYAVQLSEWSSRCAGSVKRARQATVRNLEYNLQPLGDSHSAVDPAELFECIVKEGPRYALEVARRVQKSKREEAGITRAEREKRDRERYAMELAAIIEGAGLPVVAQIQQLDNPSKAWKRIFGNRRAKTLRNRLRAWSKYRQWLVAYSAREWPASVSDLIKYVEDRINEGCPRTLPDELQAALVVLEQTGRVPDSDKLSTDSLWVSHMKSWSAELKESVEPRGTAPPYTVAILISLELLVTDDEACFYDRVIGWAMLLAVWACMRVDDVQNILPESVKVSTRGLTVKLSRTKTTGSDKLHGQVSAFVARDITITGRDWLLEGVQLFKHETAVYPRDYLVPAPNEAWNGFRKKLVEPPQLANYFRMVLQKLNVPVYQDGNWRTNAQMELVPEAMALFWTGHSARHVLPQAAAAVGVPKTDRDFLGRWAIGRVGSNAYLLTSRQVVERVQREVLSSFSDVLNGYDETELLEMMKEFADKSELIGHRVRRRHKVLPVPAPDNAGLNYGFEDPSDTEDVVVAEDDHSKEEAYANTIVTGKQSDGYFITISRRTGFRRIHVTGGCHIQAEKCQQVQEVTKVQEGSFDAMCKFCKRKLQDETGDPARDETSDSDGSSTSTSTSTSDEDEVDMGS